MAAVDGATDTVTQGAGKKFGGIPVVVWGVIIGAPILLYLYVKNKNAAATAAQVVVPQPYSNIGSSSGTTSAVSPVPSGPTGPQTNDQWLVLAEQTGINLGYSATTVQPALSAWLAGQTISSDQALVVNTIVAKIGPPPQSPTGGGVQPTTGSSNADWGSKAVQWLVSVGESAYDAQLAVFDFLQGKQISEYQFRLVDEVSRAIGPAPVPVGGSSLIYNGAPIGAERYTTQAGDTWSSLGVRFGGSSELWTQIYNANVGLGLPGDPSTQLPVGITIQIPLSVTGTDAQAQPGRVT